SDGRDVTRLELLHGDPGLLGEGPCLRVASSIGEDRLQSARRLAWGLWDERLRPPRDQPLEEHLVWHARAERERRARGEPRWTSVRIPVDGRAVRFDLLVDAPSWVARAELGK